MIFIFKKRHHINVVNRAVCDSAIIAGGIEAVIDTASIPDMVDRTSHTYI